MNQSYNKENEFKNLEKASLVHQAKKDKESFDQMISKIKSNKYSSFK